MNASGECPVCKSEPATLEQRMETHFIQCARCGAYEVTDMALAVLTRSGHGTKSEVALLSHAIRRMSRPGHWPRVDANAVKHILVNTKLPRPREQINNLVLWLGIKQDDPGTSVADTPETIAAVGAVDHPGLGYVVEQAYREGLITAAPRPNIGASRDYAILPLQLTLQGWEWFEDLQRGRARSKIAFMAMPFGDAALDAIYRDHWQPAVVATGFTLKRLDEAQPAGLIDDRLRVEIAQSKFLIADLTTKNAGAYWESGYAEGLGRPVIYTCRKDVFENEFSRPHFDTNHHLTVVWDPTNLPAAAQRMKDTVRATFPDEATLEDTPG